ncbi:hypothetical protein GCM10012275_17390 [Longimycelium tulufanense]|uniref:S-adenosyl methyltransferase n=1 Tax=Longimycelium tulufanense TaxID=907463 RepID=A0A8J3FT74_9PSEU|nr:SAM-dependent methyltransferase [Longimycelium tulufanense]GGM46871.1 hypothetical protein GCM10012275_17390 [Longimycelium tulufanense]
MERPSWAPADIDLDRPSAARVYDYYLGGSHNFAVDREMAEQAIALWPNLPLIMQANRAFLRRAVRYCVDQGIRQFLDIGSGIPTVGNVHEVAQEADPRCRVLYVDFDPVAVAHSRAILAGNERADIVHADLRKPEDIVGSPQFGRLIEPQRPMAVLMVAVLHFIDDADDPVRLVARYRDLLAPGSYLVLSHATQDGQPDKVEDHQKLYARTRTPMHMRSRAEVGALFTGFELVDPGIVYLPQWRPESSDDVDEHPERYTGYAAVGRKP